MKLERAKEICGMITLVMMASHGIDAPQISAEYGTMDKLLKALKEIELADMLEAQVMVSQDNDARQQENIGTGKSTSIQMTTHPRGVAALYVWLHFTPTPVDSEDIEPVFQIGRECLLLITVKRFKDEEDTNG